MSATRRGLLAASGIAAIAPRAMAQAYPTRVVTVIVPYPPGGPTDSVARLYADRLGELLGQRFVVENRPGAGGAIGVALAARAAPDGYTLLLGTAGTQTTVPVLQRPPPYDPVRDFSAISLLTIAPMVLSVSNALPVRTVAEFLDYARRNPGQLNFGSDGHGSTTHLAGELLKIRAGIEMQHVPYRGTAQVITAIVGGELPVGITGSTNAIPLHRDGRLRILAVTGATRTPALPDIPTLQEAGVADFDVSSWFAFFAPAGTPIGIRRQLASEIRRIAELPDVQQRMLALGQESRASTPEALDTLVSSEVARWRDLVARANIQLQ